MCFVDVVGFVGFVEVFDVGVGVDFVYVGYGSSSGVFDGGYFVVGDGGVYWYGVE